MRDHLPRTTRGVEILQGAKAEVEEHIRHRLPSNLPREQAGNRRHYMNQATLPSQARSIHRKGTGATRPDLALPHQLKTSQYGLQKVQMAAARLALAGHCSRLANPLTRERTKTVPAGFDRETALE